jgi:hypothetical protein
MTMGCRWCRCGRWCWVPVVVVVSVVGGGGCCCCAEELFPNVVVASVVVHSISASTNCSRNGGTAAAGDEVGASFAVDVLFVIYSVCTNGSWFSSGSLRVLVYLSTPFSPPKNSNRNRINGYCMRGGRELRTRYVVCSGCSCAPWFRVFACSYSPLSFKNAITPLAVYNYSYLVLTLARTYTVFVGNRDSREKERVCSLVAGFSARVTTMVIWHVHVDDFVVTTYIHNFCLSLPISLVRHPELRMQSLEGMDGKERYQVRTVWMDGWMQVERVYGQTDSAEQVCSRFARSKKLGTLDPSSVWLFCIAYMHIHPHFYTHSLQSTIQFSNEYYYYFCSGCDSGSSGSSGGDESRTENVHDVPQSQ